MHGGGAETLSVVLNMMIMMKFAAWKSLIALSASPLLNCNVPHVRSRFGLSPPNFWALAENGSV